MIKQPKKRSDATGDFQFCMDSTELDTQQCKLTAGALSLQLPYSKLTWPLQVFHRIIPI